MPLDFTGFKTFEVNTTTIDDLYKNKIIPIWDNRYTFYPNLYLELVDAQNPKHTCLGYVDPSGSMICKLETITASGVKPRNREQVFALDALMREEITTVILTGSAGTGKTILALAMALEQIQNKAYEEIIITRPMSQVGKYSLGSLPGPQPLGAKIVTPDGWTTMGALKIGDYVINEEGSPVQVLGVYPKGEKEVYRLTTMDGTSTECCADHLWFTYTKEERKRGKEGKVRSTKEIIETIYRKKVYGKNKLKANHLLPRNKAVMYNKQELPIHPYLLGVLLGDGSFSNSISFSNTDEELIDRVDDLVNKFGGKIKRMGENIQYNISTNPDSCKSYRPIRATNINTGEVVIYPRIGIAIEQTKLNRNQLNSACKKGNPINNVIYTFLSAEIKWTNTLKEKIDKLGLLHTNALTKFIPDIYKYNSIECRLEILRGLMDTDGTVKKTGESSFCSISKQLSQDLIEITRSLGGRATLCSRNRIGKQSKMKGRVIITRHISYEFTVSLPEEYNPFYISRKHKYYKQKIIHGQWIMSIEPIGYKEVQCILVDSLKHLYLTDNFLITHNTAQEKFEPYLQNYITNLKYFVKGRDVSHLMDIYKFRIVPLQLIRGASYSGAFILADEVQVLEHMEILTLGTRVGEGSKIVIMGDLDQRDEKIAREKTGIYHLFHSPIAKVSPLVASIELQQSERSSTATLFSEIFSE